MEAAEIINLQFFKDLRKSSHDGLQVYLSLTTCLNRLAFAEVRIRDISRVTQVRIEPSFEKWLAAEEDKEDFHQTLLEICMLASEAVHHLHSVFDPLACAIYKFNIPENSREISDRDLNLHKVRSCKLVPKKYQELLGSIASADSFSHLAALSNQAKHSQIVRPSFSHLTNGVVPESAEHAMLFEPCEAPSWFKQKRELSPEFEFPSTPISKFLKEELQRVVPLFNQIVGLIRSDLDSRLKAEKL